MAKLALLVISIRLSTIFMSCAILIITLFHPLLAKLLIRSKPLNVSFRKKRIQIHLLYTLISGGDLMANNNQNFNSKTPNAMSQEFGNETDVNQIKQQIQQAEAKKMQASGSTNSMSQEFGNETDVNEIRQQIQQAEANKKFASGRFSNENNTK